MFAMPTRFLLLSIDGILLMVICKVLTFGHDFSKGPIKDGCRKITIKIAYHIACTFFLFVTGMWTSVHHDDVDYSYYLGNNYKKEEKVGKRTSTYVSNHVSWLDPIIMIKCVRPAFSPEAGFKNIPLFNTLIDCLDSIYIPRGGTDASKARALEEIRTRQELIEETGKYSPFLIFAEAGTSNGTSIIKFKKGAFFAEKRVRPIYMKHSNGTVNAGFEVMEFLPLTILQLSWCCMTCSVHVLPDFQPNEFFFKKHAK